MDKTVDTVSGNNADILSDSKNLETKLPESEKPVIQAIEKKVSDNQLAVQVKTVMTDTTTTISKGSKTENDLVIQQKEN